MNFYWTEAPGPGMTRLEGNCQQQAPEFTFPTLPFNDFLQFLFHSVSQTPSGIELYSSSSSLQNPESLPDTESTDDNYQCCSQCRESEDEEEREVFQSTSFQIGRGMIPKVSIRFATRTPSMSSHPDPEQSCTSTVPTLPPSRRPSPQPDMLAFYKNFSASYGRRRRSRTLLNSDSKDSATPFSSAKGLSRSVPMKLNSLAKRSGIQSTELSPIPAVEYNSPQPSAPTPPAHDTVYMDGADSESESENESMEEVMDTLNSKTMSLFLNAATSPAPPAPRKLVNKPDVSTRTGRDAGENNQVLQRRKTLC